MKKLPRTYWPIMLAALLIALAVGAAIGVFIGANPYITALLAGGGLVLGETYQLKREGY